MATLLSAYFALLAKTFAWFILLFGVLVVFGSIAIALAMGWAVEQVEGNQIEIDIKQYKSKRRNR